MERPSPARIYDYVLGGRHNFAADRAAADAVLAEFPGLRDVMWHSRAFLRRVVRHVVAEAGIDQILDLGSGIPTVGNVHEIAFQHDPDARVVYVDIDPVAVAHARELLSDVTNATAIRADLRDPDAVLADPETRALLDFGRPVAVLLLAALHFVPDGDDPEAIVRRYLAPLVPGGCLALSHMTSDSQRADEASGRGEYERRAQPLYARSRERIAGFFDGLSLVDPGVVPLPYWHPDAAARPDPADAFQYGYGGVGLVTDTRIPA
jgi:hypothetical protein